MAANTIERINQLTAERLALYGQASNGRRGDPEVIRRIQEITVELQRLWDQRRQERAGRRDGIDALVDHAYRVAYGERYEEAISPLPVAEPKKTSAALAA
jgi:hypothetical protein